ncbi:helix-turn-helix transcriptional regulator [Ruminococcus sp.]|uniref:helix-turn-helix domain-containing protein n=1 Tax=Ruminococcus sp. TaxID=41978 RepID=UPI0025E84193|nr:helix-turn-helix transcriptional regulator [Ruminococcus sp.]
MKFSEKLRNLRMEKGLSQEELAGIFDVSRQTVSKWEAGASLPEVDKLIALSDYFQVTIDYLLRDKQIFAQCPETLDRSILQFLGSSYEMEGISKHLVQIVEDGVIDAEEMVQMEHIICTLDKIAKNIEKIRAVFHQEHPAETEKE